MRQALCELPYGPFQVYWAGPIGGALLAAVLYQVIFRARQEMGPTASATTNDLEMNHDAKLW